MFCISKRPCCIRLTIPKTGYHSVIAGIQLNVPKTGKLLGQLKCPEGVKLTFSRYITLTDYGATAYL